ncbi:hypothetical protein CBR_g17743 [Chara braunii]|uniref:Uncharacterized protein n=1 Tax=Chara braunii TaxID=69332 RepID=A0A388KVR2_CHABU|nr:hypothetical protein CBR_g17743 [Chara braunii]|eukprot:GBG74033.1 hypothetical protein CBR_g17743 [Chara braunii]
MFAGIVLWLFSPVMLWVCAAPLRLCCGPVGVAVTYLAVDTKYGYREYEVDANGVLVMRLQLGLGYVGDDLRDASVFVTKLHEDVPNGYSGREEDIIEHVVRLLLSSIALEHDGRMTGIAEWEVILDAPLVGRPYLHGELRVDT